MMHDAAGNERRLEQQAPTTGGHRKAADTAASRVAATRGRRNPKASVNRLPEIAGVDQQSDDKQSAGLERKCASADRWPA